MNPITRTSFTLGLLFLCVFTLSPSSSGQSVWLDPTVESSISLEILKPDFWVYSPYGNYGYVRDDVKAYSTVWFLTLRTYMTANAHLVIELPSVHYDATRTGSYWDPWQGYGSGQHEVDAQSMIGNVLVSLEHRSLSSGVYFQFGIRLPLGDKSQEGEGAFGALADVNRFEAFLEDVITFKTRLGVRPSRQSGLIFPFFIGLNHVTPTDNRRVDNSETYLDYGGQLWLATEKVRIGAGLVGLFWLNDDRDGFGESSFHQFGFSASFGSSRVRPGFHLRVPLDDDLPGLQFVWGLNLQIKLGSN